VQIFDDTQHRVRIRLLPQPGEQGFQCLLTLPLGGEGERRIVRWRRQGEQRREQRHQVNEGDGGRGQGVLQLVQLVGGCVGAGKGQGALQVGNHRVEGTLLGLRGAAALDAGRRRPHDLIPDDLDQAGLANARFARQQDDLSHACGGVLPAFTQQANLLLSAHQACQAARRGHFETGLCPALV
jgi:hypothetical protein